MSRTLRLATLAVGALLVVSACSSGATATPTTAPTSAAPSATASGAPSATASASPTTAAITVPKDQLVFPEKLVVCIDIPYPPQEMFDASGTPIGSDVEIAQEIAKRLGLTPMIQNSVFRHDHPGRHGREVRHHRQRPEHQPRPGQAGRHDPLLPGGPVLRGRKGQSEEHQVE